MLVLALMAIASMWVLPRFIGNNGGDVETESRQMLTVLRLAAEEAQLTGLPMHCVVGSNGYRFYRSSEQGDWLAMDDEPFLPFRLTGRDEGLQVTIAGNPAAAGRNFGDTGESVLDFYADGGLTLADIRLGNAAEWRRIRLRPGPGGIGWAP